VLCFDCACEGKPLYGPLPNQSVKSRRERERKIEDERRLRNRLLGAGLFTKNLSTELYPVNLEPDAEKSQTGTERKISETHLVNDKGFNKNGLTSKLSPVGTTSGTGSIMFVFLDNAGGSRQQQPINRETILRFSVCVDGLVRILKSSIDQR
jgi:hypothetical protein